jgi:hypothetical protein
VWSSKVGREAFQAGLAWCHVLAVAGGKIVSLLESAPMVLTPVAWQGTGPRGFVRLAVPIAELGHGVGGALTAQDGFENAGAGPACEGRNALRPLHMHFPQGLLPMLAMWRGIPHQPIALTPGASEDAEVIVRPKRGTRQPDAMQRLKPLTIDHVSLASRGVFALARVDQGDLKTACFEYRTQGHPVHPSGCHGHSVSAALLEPVSEGVQVNRAGMKGAHGLGGAVLRHGDEGCGSAAVDARGIGVQGLGRALPSCVLASHDRVSCKRLLQQEMLLGGRGSLPQLFCQTGSCWPKPVCHHCDAQDLPRPGCQSGTGHQGTNGRLDPPTGILSYHRATAGQVPSRGGAAIAA